MDKVKAKKYLGQHFLTDLDIARRIVDALQATSGRAIEIGPGMGVLTQFLAENNAVEKRYVEIDSESVEYLKKNLGIVEEQIISADFLKLDLGKIFDNQTFSVIGNFPYNISSQIFFHILDAKELVPEIVCMLQREVARRLASPPGNKDYGILSVFLQAYYDIEYLFTVDENVFDPPPKVKSGVIRLTKNGREHLNCNERLFRTVVKTTFNQRRKMIWNGLKAIDFDHEAVREHRFMKMRPEQLSVDEFVELTNLVEANPSKK